MSNFAARIASLGASRHYRLGELFSGLAVDAVGSNHLVWDSVPAPVSSLVNGDLDGAQDLGSTSKSAAGAVVTAADNFSLCVIVSDVDQSQVGYIAYSGIPGTNGWGLAIHDGSGAAGRSVNVVVGSVTLSALAPRIMYPDTKYLLTLIRRSGTWELWINDILHASIASSAPVTPTTRFIVGDSIPAAGNDFIGVVDEVAVFGSAISQANIIELTKLVFMQPPASPEFSAAPGDDGFDEFTLVSAATSASFPVAGYAIWEGDSSDEDGFDFSRSPRETIATSGGFSPRRADIGKHYAIRAFDDRTIPNYGSPQILASVGVPVDVVAAVEASSVGTNAALAVSQTTTAAQKAAVRAGISGRWTNQGRAAGRDDIAVTDIP
jgi:hypothetical protein